MVISVKMIHKRFANALIGSKQREYEVYKKVCNACRQAGNAQGMLPVTALEFPQWAKVAIFICSRSHRVVYMTCVW